MRFFEECHFFFAVTNRMPQLAGCRPMVCEVFLRDLFPLCSSIVRAIDLQNVTYSRHPNVRLHNVVLS
jgi:hypothetical protein